MAKAPNELTIKDVTKRIAERSPDWLTVNRRYVEGDHYQDGAGWTGPRPAANDPGAASVLDEIKRAFVSKNIILECVRRHRGGVIGHEPAWSVALRRPLADDEEPTPIEQALISEAEALLVVWWDARSAHQELQAAVATLLWAERAGLRLYVPSGLAPDGIIPSGSVADQMNRIYLHAPEPEQHTVSTDRATMQDVGIYAYKNEDNKDEAELVYLNEDTTTTIRVLVGTDVQDTEPLDLGGRLSHYELRRDTLITEQVRQQQRLHNMAKTMMGRNVVIGGFLERILLNAQMPGRYEDVKGADGKTSKHFIPDASFQVGPGTTNFLTGVTYEDDEGKVQMASPSVVYRDPVAVTTFETTAESAYTGILQETHQLHAAIASSINVSGESRKQTRADFEMSLGETVAPVNRAITWLLETVLALASAFAGQSGRYAELRIVATCQVDAGPISADDQRETRENVAAGLLSEEAGMMRIGVDDPAAMRAQIAAERAERSQAEQQTLAAAVLRAQRSLDGGRASTGLEQPEGDVQDEQ